MTWMAHPFLFFALPADDYVLQPKNEQWELKNKRDWSRSDLLSDLSSVSRIGVSVFFPSLVEPLIPRLKEV